MGKETKLSTSMYFILQSLFTQNKYVSSWLAFIKSTLDECGLSNIWHGYQPLTYVIMVIWERSIIICLCVKTKIYRILENNSYQTFTGRMRVCLSTLP